MRVLSTECGPLDALLDGGLEADAITLVFGEGGSGKTNLALQCARSATRAGKRVAYVDTEGVSSKRLEQVFAVGPDGLDERLLFFTPFSIQEQERLLRNATVAPELGLLVVDSINMHYRLHLDDENGEREAARSLYKQLHQLTNFARQKQVPVLITGQVYGGEDATQPFARRTMEHLVKALVRFEKRPDGTRRATVLKHRSIEEGRQARFRIAAEGLVGVPVDDGAATRTAREQRARDAVHSGGAASAAQPPTPPRLRSPPDPDPRPIHPGPPEGEPEADRPKAPEAADMHAPAAADDEVDLDFSQAGDVAEPARPEPDRVRDDS